MVVVGEVRGVRVFCCRICGEEREDALAIDAMVWQGGICNGGDGGEDVDGHERFGAGGVCWDSSGPTHDAGDAGAAFEARAFAFAEGCGGSGVISVGEPRPVIGGEDDEGVVLESVPFECGENLTDCVVDLHDDIRVEACAGFSFELVAHEEGDVGHVGGEIEKERTILVLLDELDGAFCVLAGEEGLIFAGQAGFEGGIVFVEREWRVGPGFGFWVMRPHVVGVRDAEVFIEAVLGGQEVRVVSEMPFSGHSRGVSFLFEEPCDGGFVGVQADFGAGTKCSAEADAIGVTAGEKRGAGCRADRLCDMEVRELPAIFRELVQMGSGDGFGSEATDIGVSLVIREDQNDIRAIWICLERQCDAGEGEEEEEEVTHGVDGAEGGEGSQENAFSKGTASAA